MANDSIDCFKSVIGGTQGQLDELLLELEGDNPDFRVKRGFAHIYSDGTSLDVLFAGVRDEESGVRG